MPRHLLATNDFPPKVGGIQAYLWELWRRLDPETCAVLTARSDPNWAAFDAAAPMPVDRVDQKLLYLPGEDTRQAIEQATKRHDAGLVLLDPALPLGLLGRKLSVPYGLVLHGAEITIPGRLPVSRQLMAKVVRGASVLVAAGGYPQAEAERALGHAHDNVLQVPPGVDTEAFTPVDATQRAAIRARLSVGPDELLVASVSRLVPRKGMDTLIEAAALLSPEYPGLKVMIAGGGRDAKRLQGLVARRRAPVTMLGRIEEREKVELLAAADLFVMDCRERWAGLEQEGFGIVFLEAAACGTAQVAGRSGGAHEAVADGETGLVVDRPGDPRELAAAMATLLADPARRAAMGEAGRTRAVNAFAYDVLAPRLGEGLAATMRSMR